MNSTRRKSRRAISHRLIFTYINNSRAIEKRKQNLIRIRSTHLIALLLQALAPMYPVLCKGMRMASVIGEKDLLTTMLNTELFLCKKSKTCEGDGEDSTVC